MKKFGDMSKNSLIKISKEIFIFILFFMLTLILRLKSFNYRIIDWDESLYFMWAKDLFHGTLPYVSIMEDKPIGISFIYALSFIIFGSKSMFSVKMLALFFVSASSYFLYKTGKILNTDNYSELTGLLAGIFYCIFSCYNHGITENTEVFFILFTMIAFYLLFKNIQELDLSNINYKAFFCIGLILGLGFLIKYVVLFDLISVLIILTICTLLKIVEYNKTKTLIKLFLFIFLGFALPQIGIIFIYIITGKLNYFINDTLFIFKHASSIPFNLDVLLNNLFISLNNYKFLYCFLLLCVFIKKFNRKQKLNILYLFLWFFVILFEVLFLLLHYCDHYCIQLLPPLCLLSSYLITSVIKLIKDQKFIVSIKIIIICGLLFFYKQTFDYVDTFLAWYGKSEFKFKNINGKIIPFYNDNQYHTAEYIKNKIGQGKYIFVMSVDYILYDMTNSKHTTKYVMVNLLINKSLNKIINQKQEIIKILDNKPEYIIMQSKNTKYQDFIEMLDSNIPVKNLIDYYIVKHYTFDKKIGDNILYRLDHN